MLGATAILVNAIKEFTNVVKEPSGFRLLKDVLKTISAIYTDHEVC